MVLQESGKILLTIKATGIQPAIDRCSDPEKIAEVFQPPTVTGEIRKYLTFLLVKLVFRGEYKLL